ncbi:MAG TPA: hypothetical protein VHV75_10240 [Solirubrobacteraceae bacterium]|nr:hypothetical protein [Solirubrobacteraceae bacterium]
MLNRLVHGAEFDSSNGHAIEATGSSHVAQQVVLGSHAERAEVLRGQAIREAAVRVLVSSNRAHEALHYREWFELLLDAGMLPAGKDPLATFLTQLGRSPVVAKSTSQGIYMLDHEFVHRAHQRLGALTQELRETQLSPVAADADALGNTRRRRAELMSEVERTEMELEEALRSLGGAGEQQLLAAAGA